MPVLIISGIVMSYPQHRRNKGRSLGLLDAKNKLLLFSRIFTQQEW